jgi:hypothetical protein
MARAALTAALARQLRNAATPQRPINAHAPTPKTSKAGRQSPGSSPWEFAFLLWTFWALRRWALIAELGVAKLRN